LEHNNKEDFSFVIHARTQLKNSHKVKLRKQISFFTAGKFISIITLL